MDETTEWLERSGRVLGRLRVILGHLADVERRLRSHVDVSIAELRQSASEVDELKDLAEQMGPGRGPWDVFHRKYSVLLHEYLAASGLRPGASKPAPWDDMAAFREVKGYFDEVVGPTPDLAGPDPDDRSAVAAARDLTGLVKELAELGERQKRLEEQAHESLERGNGRAAVTHLMEAIDLFDRRRAAIGDEQQQIFFAREGAILYWKLLDANLALESWADALEVAERTKARGLLAVMGLTRLRRPQGSPALAGREEALLEEARGLVPATWSSLAEGTGVRGFELWGRAAKLRKELEEVWAELGREPGWSEYVSLRRGTAPDLEGMRSCLREGEPNIPRAALLSYIVDRETTWAFLLHPDRRDPLAANTGVPEDHLQDCARRLLLDCNGLDHARRPPDQEAMIDRALVLPPAVRRLSRQWALDDGPPDRRLREPQYAMTYLDELSERLLPAAMRQALADCQVLCVSAHGPLHGLPLHALRWDSGSYLGERFGIAYVPGAGVLRHCQGRNRARREPAPARPRTGLVACVDMLRDEPFESEADLLAPLRDPRGRDPAVRVLRGPREATKARVVEGIDRARVIHLTAHGFLASDQGWKHPLESGVLLGDGQRTRVDPGRLREHPEEFGDALLTAREVFGLSVDADLVTLRACSTGRNEVSDGDDLLGLGRAWLYAGTPSLLVSLWNVNTESSLRLLRVFYERWLGAGEPKWRAVWSAQRALLQDADHPEYRHPYHWAPFVLIGDWA
jgi:CHAT domain-containing protein